MSMYSVYNFNFLFYVAFVLSSFINIILYFVFRTIRNGKNKYMKNIFFHIYIIYGEKMNCITIRIYY